MSRIINNAQIISRIKKVQEGFKQEWFKTTSVQSLWEMAPLALKIIVIVLSLGALANGNEDDDQNKNSNSYYDACTDPRTSPRNLIPNTFHKICPETTGESLGQPICGDGTEFSFVYTSPIQRKANDEKIVIEFQGGGACWSHESCAQAGDSLSFPDTINNFFGYSCSAAAYGSDNFDGYPANFLCDTTIGDTDLSNYHYILVPYCTQDVHLGDNIASYEEGETVYHHGAHNMMSVLHWVYKHFSNPSHVFLTGCSAGGSPLPVVYDLLNHHYNSFLKGGRTVNINTIMDSAVYLTPKYFMSNSMPNWNTDTILEQTKFNQDQEHSVQYSTYLWKHILQRGSRKDKWGFLSHTNDPVSMKYWQAMGAGYYDDDDQNGNDCDSWYSDMSQSLGSVQGSFENAETFYIDGEGHCSLGLYYGLQEDGFDEWAGAIIQEQTILKRSNESVPLFIVSLSAGAILMMSALLWKSKYFNDKNGALLSEEVPTTQNSIMQRMSKVLAPLLPIGKRFENCPVTTFYFATTSLYFICMLIDGGFTHPLNNPSLGPSATTLNTFGINNPTLVVKKNQIIRLLSSGFMCSGVLTYFIATVCVFRCMRHTERVSSNTATFALASTCIMFGPNLIYTCFGNGASCGSLGFVLGMNVFSIGLSKKLGSEFGLQKPSVCSTIFFTLLAVALFPFNSWILILSAMTIGAILPCFIVKQSNEDPNINEWMPMPAKLSKVVYAFAAIFAIMFILILAGVPNPNELYQYPYLTGCGMMYSTDVGSLVQNFGGRRLGDGFDYDNVGCAQFCVPHLIEKPFYFGLKKYAAYSENEYAVDYGLCEDIGYDEHIADTTFEYLRYPLDVEVYDVAQND